MKLPPVGDIGATATSISLKAAKGHVQAGIVGSTTQRQLCARIKQCKKRVFWKQAKEQNVLVDNQAHLLPIIKVGLIM